MEKVEERRRKFFPTVSLGSVIATLAFIGSVIGVYTQTIADVNTNKADVAAIKADFFRKDQNDKESRAEMKQDIRDVKSDVKDVRNDVKELNNKVDRVLQELVRARK